MVIPVSADCEEALSVMESEACEPEEEPELLELAASAVSSSSCVCSNSAFVCSSSSCVSSRSPLISLSSLSFSARSAWDSARASSTAAWILASSSAWEISGASGASLSVRESGLEAGVREAIAMIRNQRPKTAVSGHFTHLFHPGRYFHIR